MVVAEVEKIRFTVCECESWFAKDIQRDSGIVIQEGRLQAAARCNYI